MTELEKPKKRILKGDSQLLNAIQKCQFYTYLQFVKDYKPIITSHHLERGDLGHVLLQTHYTLLKEKVVKDYEEIKKLTAEVGRKHYVELELDIETCEWVIQSYYQYADYFEYDGIQVEEVEKPFLIKLYEDDDLIIYYEGKIDLIARLPIVGVIPFDHKWRSMKADYTPLDNQFLGYAFATEAPVLYVNEVGLQSSYKPEQKFRRVPLNFNPGIVERWKQNTIQWLKLLDYCFQNNIWMQQMIPAPPSYTSQCGKCQFQKICLSHSTEEMVRKLQTEFKVQKWDVTENEDD